MANCMMGFPNRIDQAVLSGGTWMAGLPRANLQDRVIGRVARTADTALASTQFDVDLSSAKKTRLIALRNHNFSLSAKYRVRATNEAPSTNHIRNNTMVGVLPGTPGTLANFWSMSMGGTGLSRSVVGMGYENGIAYTDIRVFGTATGTGNVAIFTDSPHTTAAATGQTFTDSAFIRLVAGSNSGVTLHFAVIQELTSSGVFVTGLVYPRPAPTSAPLDKQRQSFTRTLNGGATVALVGSYLGMSISSGVVVDFTLRIGMPQLEQGAMSSVIATSGTAVTRPAGYMDDWQDYAYNSGWQDVWPVVYPYGSLEWEDDNWWSGKYTIEETEGYVAELVHILPSAKLARYWRVEIDDASNPAGYVQIGRAFIGPAWQPRINMIYGAGLGWETKTEAQEAIGGSEYFQRRTPYRVQRFTLAAMDEDEAFSQAFEMQRRAGIDQEILWVHDPDDTVHALRRRFLARLRTLSAIEFPYYSTNSAAFELKELL